MTEERKEDMSGAYGFLMRFVGTDVSERNLLRHHTQEEIDENIRDEYIVEAWKHEDGEPVYRITDKGKHKRDD